MTDTKRNDDNTAVEPDASKTTEETKRPYGKPNVKSAERQDEAGAQLASCLTGEFCPPFGRVSG